MLHHAKVPRQHNDRSHPLGVDPVVRRRNHFSSALIVLVGLYTGYHGWTGLRAQHQSAPAATMTQPAAPAG